MNKQIIEYKNALQTDDIHNGFNKHKPLDTIKIMVRNNVNYYLSQSTLISLLKTNPKLISIYKISKRLTNLVNKILIRQLGTIPDKISLINLRDLQLAKAKRTEITIKLKELK